MLEVKKETSTPPFGATRETLQSPQQENFTLAHISDLHLTSLTHAKTNQLLNKRMLGYLSWWRKRRYLHRLDIVDALIEDLRTTRPDHIAVTGDLTHIGLPAEFAEAGQWLTSLGSAEQVTVIPGNHEAYSGTEWFKNLSLWAPYLRSDNCPGTQRTEDFFPSLRIRGQVAIIGLCSARPSSPFLAIGSLGRKQLDELAVLLKTTGEKGLLRIVMVHHPPVPGTIKWRKRLVDSKAVSDVLSRYGAELVLHGHTHSAAFSELPTINGSIPVIGAASASELNPHTGRCAKYNLYEIKRNGQDWKLCISVRGYSEASGQFIQEQTITMSTPQLRPTPARKNGSVQAE